MHLEADAISETPVIIPFKWDNKTDIPNECKLDEFITIKPLTVETWFRIKPFLLEIDKEDFSKLIQNKNEIIPDNELIGLFAKYDSIIMQIVFLGIHNNSGNMPEWKRQALLSNCNWQDIHILLNAILFRIGKKSFYKSITTLRNVSPWTEQELIASQQNLESWSTLQ